MDCFLRAESSFNMNISLAILYKMDVPFVIYKAYRTYW